MDLVYRLISLLQLSFLSRFKRIGAVWCRLVQIWCSLVQFWCSLVQFGAVWCSLVQFGAVLVQFGADWKKPNTNKPSAEEVKNARAKIRLAGTRGIAVASDSEEMQIIRRSNEPDFIRYSNNKPYPTDSLVVQSGDKYRLYFPHLLQVRYTKEASEQSFTRGLKRLGFQESTLSLTGDTTEVLSNGILADPLAVLFEGYMGWEKIGNMLPVDYRPSERGE